LTSLFLFPIQDQWIHKILQEAGDRQMNIAQDKEQQKRNGWWWKIPLGLFVLVFVGLAIAVLSIDSIAHNQINKALQRYFTEGGNLGDIDIRLLEGRVGLTGLTINPPKGFGKDPLLALNRFEVIVDPSSLLGDEIVVEQLNLKALSLKLIRDKQGQLSPQKLIVPRDTATETGKTGDTQDEKPVFIPAVRIKTIRLETITVHLIDQMRDKQLSASMQLDLHVDGLVLEKLISGKITGESAGIALRDVKFKQLQESGKGDPWQAGLKRLDLNTTGVAIEDIATGAVSLQALTLDLQGVAVDQPAGFGTDRFAGLARLAIAVAKLDLNASTHVIDDILIQGPTASIKVLKDRSTNVQKLLQALMGNRQEATTKSNAREQKKDISESTVARPVIRITQIKMDQGAFNLRDESLTAEALVFPLKDIQFAASHLRLFEKNATAKPTPVNVSFALAQPGDLPTAYFGGVAHMGPLGVGVPLINSQIRLSGLKLKTFGALIPPTTDVTLGASGFDAAIALILDTDSIRVDGSGTSDKNVQYQGIKVRGPLDAPEITMGTLLAGAYSRVADGLVNLGLKGLGAGVDIVEGGLGVVKAVGKGTLEVGKNIGESVLELGAGAVTLDQQKLKQGIKGTTVDTVKLSSDTVRDSGSVTRKSLEQSASQLKGHTQLEAWDDGIAERFQKAMQAAEEDLANMPFPPNLD
jgi:hypothetical protein